MRRRGRPEVFDCACGDHSWSPLTRGFVTLVSPADRRLLETGHWQASVNVMRQWYARRERQAGEECVSPGQTVHLHREVVSELGVFVDHRNHNTLDNRRDNLRPATRSQNAANSRRRNSTGFKGVQKKVEKSGHVGYQARIADPHRRFLGYFRTAEEAARAYDRAALAHFGEFAAVNFPSECTVVGGRRA